MSEIVVHRTDGAGLPVRAHRGLVEPFDARVTRLLALALPADAVSASEIGFTAQLGAMAAASKAALATGLTCYLAWCDDTRATPLPADPEDLVRYIAMLEARGAKPATVARRVASLATAHSLSGMQERGHASPATSWSAPHSRACVGDVAPCNARPPYDLGRPSIRMPRGFTLTALLGACGGDLQGLRDAALLSLGYDAGLRVSELVAVTVAHIDPHNDGSALLFIP